LARDVLRARGLKIASLEEQQQRTRIFGGRTSHRRQCEHAVIGFIRELALLLSVGIPLLESLDSILRQHKGRFGAQLLNLRDRIASGVSLSQAMREQPRLFDELCVSITEVGEDSGTLDAALEKLAEFKERSRQLKGKIGTALIYPALVVVFATAVSAFLMSFVVPSILQPLIEMGRPLPWPTRVVKGASDFLVAWGWLLAVLGIAGVVLFAAAIRTERGQALWHRFLLGVPMLGELLRKQAVVRICVVMSALIGSGVVFVRALEVARRATKNVILKSALQRCEKAITAGSEVAGAMEGTHAFSPLVVQVFAVGQQSGRMEEMLARLGNDYDRDVATAAQRLAAILEPLLIVALALLVLLIAMATMLPILEASDVLH
jgi:type II secretory pathway component PulF